MPGRLGQALDVERVAPVLEEPRAHVDVERAVPPGLERDRLVGGAAVDAPGHDHAGLPDLLRARPVHEEVVVLTPRDGEDDPVFVPLRERSPVDVVYVVRPGDRPVLPGPRPPPRT